MSTYNHPLSYFQMPLFFLGEDKRSVGETTLESFLCEWHEGDPSKAWYIVENNNVELEPAEERHEWSDGTVDEAKDAVIGTKWEVRENDNSRMSRYRLIESFETEDEAKQYHLNGLYWNYCEGNRDTGAPYSSNKREDVEEEIKTLAEMQAEEADGE